jgi:hypothetical protein
MCLGVDGGNDDIVLTFNGNVPSFTALPLPLAFQMYNVVPASSNNNYHYAVRNFLQPQPGQWYHTVITVVPDTSAGLGAGNWYAWVNGVQQAWSGTVSRAAPGALLTSVQGASSVLNAVNRNQSYLGKSDFSDGNAQVTIDAFRVYDYALSPALISSLASAYGLLNVATGTNVSATITASNEDTQVAAALGSSNKAPIFSASFPSNPASLVGGTTNYQWQATDPQDSAAVAAYHPGVIVLTGATNSYIDLTTTYGPQSCGLLLPVFGGAGSGTFGTNQGVSFEMVSTKPNQTKPNSTAQHTTVVELSPRRPNSILTLCAARCCCA